MSDLTAYRRLLIFGGSFDPPHRAHVELPRLARQRLGFDAIVYVPAGRAPHKLDQQQTPGRHRLAMTELAVADDPHSLVLPLEVQRGADDRPSYTIDTLRELRGMLRPDAQMRLLIGTDQMLIFDTWKDADAIIELAEPVVMIRPPQTKEAALRELPPESRDAWAARIIELPQQDLSSTDVRGELEHGEDVTDQVPDTVLSYIHKHGLYGG